MYSIHYSIQGMNKFAIWQFHRAQNRLSHSTTNFTIFFSIFHLFVLPKILNSRHVYAIEKVRISLNAEFIIFLSYFAYVQMDWIWFIAFEGKL